MSQLNFNLNKTLLVIHHETNIISLQIYKEVFLKLAKSFSCIFVEGNLDLSEIDTYSAIIYLSEKLDTDLVIRIRKKSSNIPFYAVGLRDIQQKSDFLAVFKHIFLPDKNDLDIASRILGASRVHFLPDIRYLWEGQFFEYSPKGNFIFLGKCNQAVLNHCQKYKPTRLSNGKCLHKVSFAVCSDYFSEILCILAECPYIHTNDPKQIDRAYEDRLSIQSRLCRRLIHMRLLLDTDQLDNLLIHELNLHLLNPNSKFTTSQIASYLEFRSTGKIDINEEIPRTSQIIMKNPFPRKLNLTYHNQSVGPGIHRAGWQYVLDSLYLLHSDKGVLCDTYMDKTFCGGWWPLKQTGIIPYTSPWIGFVHHTPLIGYSNNTCWAILGSKEFQQSLPTCRGIICLSKYVSSWFQQRFEDFGINVPILTLYHPTLFVDKLWSNEKFEQNRKIVNIGAWYRNPFSIYRLSVPRGYLKATLRGKRMEGYFPSEEFKLDRKWVMNPNMEKGKWFYYLSLYLKNIIGKDYKRIITQKDFGLDKLIQSVEIIECLNNESYDDLFTSSIVFLNLIDASAVNTIIECIVRETPVLVNRLPALEEYLGKNYPLFYSTLSEAEELLCDEKNIEKAHCYLREMDKSYLQIKYFMNDFVNSRLYQNLPLNQ